jgi:hypothetical protein
MGWVTVGFDPEAGSSALHLWIAAGSAASLVAVCILTIVRSRIKVASALERTSVVLAGAILGAVMAWAFLDRSFGHDNDADRRALELRAEELTAHSLAPGSALPCLDALAGDDVEAACEKSLFASAANVAVASSYVTARLDLLSDIVAYVKRGGGNIDTTLVPLRRAVEADRFGFLAHALAIRDGCTSQQCKALSVLNNPSHVRANLSTATLDRYLEHYVVVWTQPADGAVADASAVAPPASGAVPPRKIVNIDFPTAASIPAVSIMNPEPAGKPAAAPAPAAAAASSSPPAADPQASQKRPRKQAANPVPSAAPATTDVPADPVWTPAPLAPPAGAAPAAPTANVASGPSGPMHLTPSSPPQ